MLCNAEKWSNIGCNARMKRLRSQVHDGVPAYSEVNGIYEANEIHKEREKRRRVVPDHCRSSLCLVGASGDYDCERDTDAVKTGCEMKHGHLESKSVVGYEFDRIVMGRERRDGSCGLRDQSCGFDDDCSASPVENVSSCVVSMNDVLGRLHLEARRRGHSDVCAVDKSNTGLSELPSRQLYNEVLEGFELERASRGENSSDITGFQLGSSAHR